MLIQINRRASAVTGTWAAGTVARRLIQIKRMRRPVPYHGHRC